MKPIAFFYAVFWNLSLFFGKIYLLAYFNISLSKKVAFWLRATPGVIL